MNTKHGWILVVGWTISVDHAVRASFQKKHLAPSHVPQRDIVQSKGVEKVGQHGDGSDMRRYQAMARHAGMIAMPVDALSPSMEFVHHAIPRKEMSPKLLTVPEGPAWRPPLASGPSFPMEASTAFPSPTSSSGSGSQQRKNERYSHSRLPLLETAAGNELTHSMAILSLDDDVSSPSSFKNGAERSAPMKPKGTAFFNGDALSNLICIQGESTIDSDMQSRGFKRISSSFLETPIPTPDVLPRNERVHAILEALAVEVSDHYASNGPEQAPSIQNPHIGSPFGDADSVVLSRAWHTPSSSSSALSGPQDAKVSKPQAGKIVPGGIFDFSGNKVSMLGKPLRKYRILHNGSQSKVSVAKMNSDHLGPTDPSTEVGKYRKVILKMVKKKTPQEMDLRIEGQLLHELNHANIIRLEDQFEDENSVVLVLPYYPMGSLARYLEDDFFSMLVMSRHRVRQLFYPIVRALVYCHELGVAHRDIKPKNIVITGTRLNPIPILIDFGLAFVSYINPDSIDDRLGTISYAPPEYMTKRSLHSTDPLKDDHLDPFKADVWSLGVTLLSAITGYIPDNHRYVTNLVQSKKRMGCFGMSKMLQDLLRGMLNVDVQQRWTMRQVLEHPWWTKRD